MVTMGASWISENYLYNLGTCTHIERQKYKPTDNLLHTEFLKLCLRVLIQIPLKKLFCTHIARLKENLRKACTRSAKLKINVANEPFCQKNHFHITVLWLIENERSKVMSHNVHRKCVLLAEYKL